MIRYIRAVNDLAEQLIDNHLALQMILKQF
jgi:hypothetical protein